MFRGAKNLWQENGGNLMLALIAVIIAFGFYVIYWTQVTYVRPFRVRYPVPIVDGESGYLEGMDGVMRIKVEGLQDESGKCMLALYQSPEDFNDPEHAVMKEEQTAVRGAVLWEVDRLPKGRFAVAAFEDRNGNGVLDKNALGVPTERYGFSKNPKPGFGPPAFDDVAIEVEGVVEVVIQFESPQ